MLRLLTRSTTSTGRMTNRSPIRKPTVADLSAIARSHNLQLTDDDLSALLDAGKGLLSSFERLNVLPEPALLPTVPRLAGTAPLPSENKLGAWQWRTDIVAGEEQRKSSLLLGYTVALKDNVCVAGVPMSNGSRVLEGFVPTQDATLVQRILDAGGRIVGKTACEDFCSSGGSHTSAFGLVHNPHCPGRTSGGSSSGSAVVVAIGDADMAIGGDQGGSIRTPSCLCGVVGFKPSFGAVPYTGVVSIEATIDHAGPIAKDVFTASLLFEAIAGRDGLDARQDVMGAPEFGSWNGLSRSLPKTLEQAKEVVRGVKFGVLREAFSIPDSSEEDVDVAVREMVQRVAAVGGASLVDLSIPEHREGQHLLQIVGVEGAYMTQFSSGGQALGLKGHYMTDLMRYHTRGMLTRSSSMSWRNQMYILVGEYIHKNYGGEFYGKGQNVIRALATAYDNALDSDCEVLALPTVPFKAPLLPDVERCSIQENIAAVFKFGVNSCPFNLTGHPAITLPAAFIPCEGSTVKLPVGLTLVGRRMHDGDLLKIARAVELLRGDLHAEGEL